MKINLLITVMLFAFSAYSQDCTNCIPPYDDRCMNCLLKALQTAPKETLQEQFNISPKTAQKIASIPKRADLKNIQEFHVFLDQSEWNEISSTTDIHINGGQGTTIVSGGSPTINQTFNVNKSSEEFENEREEHVVNGLTREQCLGDLLLEGYKLFLSLNKGKMPRRLRQADVDIIYQFVISSSDFGSRQVNILMAQIQLFKLGLLSCKDEGLAMKEWNWSDDLENLMQIPKITFVKKMEDLNSLSKLGKQPLSPGSNFYRLRANKIISFKSSDGDMLDRGATMNRYFFQQCSILNHTFAAVLAREYVGKK